MAFSDYKTISQIQKEFGIKYQEENFIQIQPFEASQAFLEDIKFNLENIDVYTSEASRTELIVTPILLEVYKKYYEKYSFWIQKYITYTDKLSGTPDYMIATKSPLGKTVLDTPLIVIVEAKKNDFEQGWGQCLAELVAAQKINEDNLLPVYGIVTDGELWKFGKLIDTTFTKNIDGYTVTALSKLLGAIDFILQAASPK